MQKPYRVGVAGCNGAVGRIVVKFILAHPECTLSGGTASPQSKVIGQDVARLAGLRDCGVAVRADAKSVFSVSDAVVDFSVPIASACNAQIAAEAGIPLVLATTGLDDEQIKAVEDAAIRAPILLAPNLSPGMAVMRAMVQLAARNLSDDYDAEVLSFAHRRKRDAPSGGALALGRTIARARGIDATTNEIHVRNGDVGPRPRGKIGYANLRGGEGAGEHSAIFAGDWERLEVTHRVMSRDLYASVAIDCAIWLSGRLPGLYTLEQVLGLDHVGNSETAESGLSSPDNR